MKNRLLLASSITALSLTIALQARAVASAELYQNQTFTFGRFEARLRFAAGDGVVSSFFLWKPGSEVAGTYWNELDFEKLGADCYLQTNPLYGQPVVDHGERATLDADLCGEYHTYTFEWTPSYIAFLVDGVEIRREGEEAAAAFADNAASGMQIRFNIWPGDATFGGNFDPAILPVQQFISWVQYSAYSDGAFVLEYREEFDGDGLPSGWAVGDWASPKNLSTHQPANVQLSGGAAVLSLTADDATGFDGTPPPDTAEGGAGGAPGAGGEPGAGGAPGGDTGGAAGASAGSDPPEGGAAGAAGDLGGDAGTSQPSGASAAPSSSPSASGSSDGGCSYAPASTSARGAAWWLLGAAALVVSRRRRRPDRGRRRLAPPSL